VDRELAGLRHVLARQFKDGAELSGGQCLASRRARGFLPHRALLIMDDPTAASSALAEYALSPRCAPCPWTHCADHHPPSGVGQALRPHLRPAHGKGRRVRHAPGLMFPGRPVRRPYTFKPPSTTPQLSSAPGGTAMPPRRPEKRGHQKIRRAMPYHQAPASPDGVLAPAAITHSGGDDSHVVRICRRSAAPC